MTALPRKLNRFQPRRWLSTASVSNDFTHCIIGGGVVGLAVARELAAVPNARAILLERHTALGTETSSRNSEVIHAGLYYPPDSLKTRLCIQGRDMMYEYCRRRNVPHMKCGKWIVAQDDSQRRALEGIFSHAAQQGVPMRWLSAQETAVREPNVRAQAGALESPMTGIVDSHALMQSFQVDFEDSGGDIAVGAEICEIEPLNTGPGYMITTNDGTVITSDVIVNSAGLGAVKISNMLLPQERHMPAYYCKGTYFSYSKSTPKVGTLIYPAPVKGFGGLGTHLTMDMAGRLRFGPDVEWTEDPSNLIPNTTRIAAAIVAIKSYLPDIDPTALTPDYCGMRPKIKPQGEGGVGQVDFIIREESGFPGFINLLGIESPGLTSSMAIARFVHSIIHR